MSFNSVVEFIAYMLGQVIESMRAPMSFNSVAEFIAMGGHGLYVWLCYGVTLLALVLSFVLPRMRQRQLLREQAQRLRREEAGL